MTTKIVALVDALGNLARFVLLPGQRHDSIAAPDLIEGIYMEALLERRSYKVHRWLFDFGGFHGSFLIGGVSWANRIHWIFATRCGNG